jgi:O-antigen/teichoic acid export membrane protein
MLLGWRDRLRASVLARNTAWMGLGRAIRIGIQALYFVMIARALGAREYGAYVGVVALVGVAAPFAGLGSGYLLIKHVARAPQTFRVHWGKALATTAVTGTILLAVVVMGAKLVLPSSIPLHLVLVVGAADLLFSRVLDLSAQAYQGFQRLDRTAQIQLLLSPLRLLGAAVLIAATRAPTAVEWGTLYLLSSMVSGGLAVGLVNRELGSPEFNWKDLGSELREGTYFSVSLSAHTIYNDIDKTMLARLATLDAAGVYGAAYRLVDMVFLPVSSLLAASYAQFFQHGVGGLRATARFARRLLPFGVGYGLIATVGLYLLAPLVPVILGDQYRETSAAVRWLAVLPFIKGFHYFGADALTGAGHQGARTGIQVGVALLNVLLNCWLIPLYSWQGAAVASILSDGLLALGVWTMVWRIGRSDRRLSPQEQATSVLEPS